jgi:hypothetical protein
MYEYQVKSAREAVDRIPFDPSEVGDFVTKLLNESPTAQVLIFYSYLDDRIQNILALQMHHFESQNAIDRVFGLNGPLNTFSSRILIAYHLGWIAEELKTRLDAFRKMRNVFAHRAFKVTITDPDITSHLAALDYTPTGIFENLKVAVPTLPFTSNLLCNLIVLALRTFEQLLVLPIARAHHVSPGDVLHYEEQPLLTKRVQHTLVESLLIAGAHK